MGKKIKANITIDEDIWKLLPKYISESRSSWFEKQARRQINCNDEIEEINIKLMEIQNKKNTLTLEEENLIEKRDHILKRREQNKQNFELTEKAMSLIRVVSHNEGVISVERIKFIAKKYVLDYEVLYEQAKKENIKIVQKEKEKEDLKGIETKKVL